MVEWVYLLEAKSDVAKQDMKQMGLISWYTGVASQVDLKKVRVRQWMQQFKTEEELLTQREDDLQEGKKIWQDLQKNLGQQQSS